jgi:hypothetical protein
MGNETKESIPSIEEAQKDEKVTGIILQSKSLVTKENKEGTKEYPKEQAVRMLKNQKKQKGFHTQYKIVKVVR